MAAAGSSPRPSGNRVRRRTIFQGLADHPVARWWSVETWTKAGDLALKLLAVVAAVAALNFLTVSPKLSLDVRCRRVVDDGRVAALYAVQGSSTPPVVTQSIDLAKGRTNAVLSSAAPRTRCAQTISPESLLSRRNNLTQGQLAFALHAIHLAERVDATVTVTNRGKGSAANVEIEAPPVFVRSSLHEARALSPGDATIARFQARQEEEEAALGSVLAFRAHSDRKLTVDIQSLLILLAVLAGVFLVPALALDFVRFSRAMKTPGQTTQPRSRRNGRTALPR